jgi:PIN domain nuclease of toxin-antitoxin system
LHWLRPENQILVSSVTSWEISLKHTLGRLEFPLDLFDEMIQRVGFEALPIQPAHGIAAGRLPRHHRDPFDRILIAQALTEDLTLYLAFRLVHRRQKGADRLRALSVFIVLYEVVNLAGSLRRVRSQRRGA